MKLGNRIHYHLNQNELGRMAFRRIFRMLGPYRGLNALSLLGLRGRVSRQRREFERSVLSRLLEGNSPVLLVGIKSYNYHYISAYRSNGELDLMEPNQEIETPPGIRRENCFAQEWKPTTDYYGLIDLFGVYGHGLNDREGLLEAIRRFHEGLRPGGILLFGFNVDHDPLALGDHSDLGEVFPGFQQESRFALDTLRVALLRKIAAPR